MNCEICKRFKNWSEPCFDENNLDRFDNYPDSEKPSCEYFTNVEKEKTENAVTGQDIIETDVVIDVDMEELSNKLAAQRYDLNDDNLFVFEPLK